MMVIRIALSGDFAINTLTRWETALGEIDYKPISIVHGQQENFTVTGLNNSTTYWFAVRLRDVAGNFSGFSPSPSCKTNSPPQIWLTKTIGGEEWGTATTKATSTIVFEYGYFDPDAEDTHTFDILMAPEEGQPFDIIIATGITTTTYIWDSRNIVNARNYFLKIVSRDQRGLTGYISTGTVSINNLNEPPIVKIFSPTGGEFWQGIHLIIWTYHDPNRTDTVYCQILISTDGGASFVYEDKYVRDSEIPYLWGTGNYPDSKRTIVKIKAIDNKGAVGESLSAEFEIFNTNLPPEAFNLLEPADNVFVYTSTPTLKWEKRADPDGDNFNYILYISTSQDFIPRIEISGITTNAHSISLNDETKYYWKVIAIDAHLIRRPSNDVRTFTVNVNPPEVISTFPENGDWLVLRPTETIKIQLNLL